MRGKIFVLPHTFSLSKIIDNRMFPPMGLQECNLRFKRNENLDTCHRMMHIATNIFFVDTFMIHAHFSNTYLASFLGRLIKLVK